MLAELKDRSQVTIPKSVVSELGLHVGDRFDVIVHKGEIRLVPVVVYPKSEVDRLERLASQAEAALASGDVQVFDNAEDLLVSLHTSA
jgi:AbrB family looped-hinge helix DNA binding protein